MEDNPFAGILDVVRTDADERSMSPWAIGTVAAVAPLTRTPRFRYSKSSTVNQ